MSASETLDIMTEKNNGYLITSDVTKAGFSKTFLSEYVKKRNMERVAQGVYMSEGAWLDEMYIVRLRNSKAVFSHESALYIHGLMDSEPSSVTLTIPTGYNATHLRKQGYKVYTVPREILKMGQIEKENSFENKVFVYDIDRTICDVIKAKDDFEIQTFQTALKEYMRSKEKNLNNLMKYAEALKITSKVRTYTEVML